MRKIQYVMDMKMNLLSWFITFLIKIFLIQTKKLELIMMVFLKKMSWIDNYRNQLLKNPENERYIRVL